MTSDSSISPPKHTWWYRSFLAVMRPLVLPLINRHFGIRTERYKGEVPGPCMVMFNHVSDYDPFGVLQGFAHYTRYVASDALVRKRKMRILFGIVSDFIYRRKGENGDNVVRSVKATIDKGIHVCMSPEGGESINGTTAFIRPRTGSMIKEVGCGLVTFRMEGGYFMRPSWCRHRFKGPMFGKVVGTYSKEQLADMTAEEINDLIYRDLYVNSYEWQREHMIVYEGERRAERMEQVLYTCPKCHRINTIHSDCDDVYCDACGYRVKVNKYGFFEGEDLVYDNLYSWDVWQRDLMFSKLEEFKADPEKVILSDSGQVLKGLKDNYPYVIEEDVTISMSAARISIEGKVTHIDLPLSEIKGVTVVSREDIGITFGDTYYQIGSVIPRSGVKYKQLMAMLRGRPYL
ncbi:MAG: 1-acyl-sn-glycerol-3-phosphate acyltransferase [archaeon]|nr:1-acyl-sn-glycerol-3-phosphate acyltransferase [archaeon]